MKPQKLEPNEYSLIPNAGDRVLLEVIKGMSVDELRAFDVYRPIYFRHYADIQCGWLEAERHLIGNRPDRCCCDVSEEELIEDINLCNNGERFRAFYVLKYPSMVSMD